MGGILKAPKPVAIAAAEPVATPAPAATPDQAASEARTTAASRARNGLAGTIVTSARGVLDPAPLPIAPRKSLLGE